jgi:hypothetical protein
MKRKKSIASTEERLLARRAQEFVTAVHHGSPEIGPTSHLFHDSDLLYDALTYATHFERFVKMIPLESDSLVRSEPERMHEIETLLREHHETFVELVLSEPPGEPILVALSAFDGEPELLHIALGFAAMRKRPIIVRPTMRDD